VYDGINAARVSNLLIRPGAELVQLIAMARYPADSQAPAVIVLTRFLMVTLILGTLIRLATKWWKFSTFFRDDYYILLAMVSRINRNNASINSV
jgi:hypothetical protein